MIAHVYKQAFPYFPEHRYNKPKIIVVVGDEMFAQIPCDDCNGTGIFPVPDDYVGDASCVTCKATGKVEVSLY